MHSASGGDVYASQDFSVLHTHEYSSVILYLIFINPVSCQILPCLSILLNHNCAHSTANLLLAVFFSLLHRYMFALYIFIYICIFYMHVLTSSRTFFTAWHCVHLLHSVHPLLPSRWCCACVCTGLRVCCAPEHDSATVHSQKHPHCQLSIQVKRPAVAGADGCKTENTLWASCMQITVEYCTQRVKFN